MGQPRWRLSCSRRRLDPTAYELVAPQAGAFALFLPRFPLYDGTDSRLRSQGLLKLLDLPEDATKEHLAAAFAASDADEVAEKAMKQGLVVTSLRSFDEWCALLSSSLPCKSLYNFVAYQGRYVAGSSSRQSRLRTRRSLASPTSSSQATSSAYVEATA